MRRAAHRPSRVWVATSFALGLAGISFAAIFVRLALPAPPVVSAFYRTLFAGVVLAAWSAGGSRGRSPQRGRVLALAAGACFGSDLALWHTSIVRTSVANATLLVNTTPIAVGALSWALWGERPSFAFGGAVLLGLLGTAVLLGSHPGDGPALGGDLLALAAAGFYSGYLLLMKEARRWLAAGAALRLATLAAAAVLAGCVVVRGDPLHGFPLASWAAILGAAFVTQIGGVFGIVWALGWTRASFASVALLGQPVGTALLGWWLLAEPLGARQSAGGALVLAAIALASRAAGEPGGGADDVRPGARRAPAGRANTGASPRAAPDQPSFGRESEKGGSP